MISMPLLKATIKSNYKVLIIFMVVLAFYFSMIVGMFDPDTLDSMNALIESLPKDLISALNFTIVDTSLLGFIAGYFYGFLILLFPLIYSIIVANRTIAKHVDKGSMAYLLSTPNTRVKIAVTQGLFLIGSITLLIAFVTLIGIISSEAMFPGALDISGFLLLNLGTLLLYYAISGIGFIASCFFNDTNQSLAVGGGIPVAFLIIQMLSNVGDQLSNLKYATLLTLFNPTDIINKVSGFGTSFVALFILSVILYSGGIYIFSKKDLPL
ncbi:ABC transporter permease subunit [Alkaliphilus transvaalensis]|uniref:ABC transporter permease subunit n=1 Tax=Alkaliphilus transvaalensis TaxID=114628 RepID=UPI000478B504|nr:ABC transporter permease subunit [Alkaliphilus transvaalensis]